MVLQQLWIFSAKQTVRRYLSKCTRYNRTHPQPLQPYIIIFSPYRGNQTKPSSVARLNLAGPFRTTLEFHRGAQLETAYLCFLVCLAIMVSFVQIEAVLNSRPLCPMSSNLNDFLALTPGHCLTLDPLTAVPGADVTTVKLYRLKKWQLTQSFHQQIWLCWKNDYLHTLNERAQWTRTSETLHANDMLLIKDYIRTSLHWPPARMVQLHPGSDGEFRVASIKPLRIIQ